MQQTRLRIIEATSCLTLSLGFSATLIGGSITMIGVSAIALIKLVNAIAPYEQVINNIVFYGVTACGSGFLFIGVDVALNSIYRQLTGCEIEEVPSEDFHFRCNECKYFSGTYLLPCAVHPRLKENCPDFEKDAH